MNTKEKAIELVKNYKGFEMTNERIASKQCALILVDEIIDEVRDYCDDNFLQDRLTYWNNVKNEIYLL